MNGDNILPFIHDFQIISSIILRGNPGILINEMRRRMNSRSSFFGLERDLTVTLAMPEAKLPIQVRRLAPEDIPYIFKKRTAERSGPEMKDVARRTLLIKARFSRCYVAAVPDDRPCYMQWLIGPDENRKVQAYFKGGFPWIGLDEILLEGAYTPPEYRGFGIMACAMFQIAEKGRQLGARRAITFVQRENSAALAGCRKAGFVPYLVRDDSWKNFRRTLKFTSLGAASRE